MEPFPLERDLKTAGNSSFHGNEKRATLGWVERLRHGFTINPSLETEELKLGAPPPGTPTSGTLTLETWTCYKPPKYLALENQWGCTRHKGLFCTESLIPGPSLKAVVWECPGFMWPANLANYQRGRDLQGHSLGTASDPGRVPVFFFFFTVGAAPTSVWVSPPWHQYLPEGFISIWCLSFSVAGIQRTLWSPDYRGQGGAESDSHGTVTVREFLADYRPQDTDWKNTLSFWERGQRSSF